MLEPVLVNPVRRMSEPDPFTQSVRTA